MNLYVIITQLYKKYSVELYTNSNYNKLSSKISRLGTMMVTLNENEKLIFTDYFVFCHLKLIYYLNVTFFYQLKWQFRFNRLVSIYLTDLLNDVNVFMYKAKV